MARTFAAALLASLATVTTTSQAKFDGANAALNDAMQRRSQLSAELTTAQDNYATKSAALNEATQEIADARKDADVGRTIATQAQIISDVYTRIPPTSAEYPTADADAAQLEAVVANLINAADRLAQPVTLPTLP